MSDCLILACSDKKRDTSGPAIEVYDGQLFTTLRKYPPRLDTFILSAKYGLISAQQCIQPYDQRIGQRTWALDQAAEQWLELGLSDYRTVYACMGWDYWLVLQCVALMAYGSSGPPLPLVKIPDGKAPIGKMKAALGEFCRAHR
ncbi:MAG: hypothetical protein KJ077_11000 [Anaerolineae bacterium]|nr:hypothetical protein [Anaerolineae bacterium]